MAYIRFMSCCGVGEVVNLTNRCSIKSIMREAKTARKGMLVVYFMKLRGKDKFKADKLMEKMLNYGFQKSGEPFVNPNSGNTIQPLHYIMKKEEKENTHIPSTQWGQFAQILDHPED